MPIRLRSHTPPSPSLQLLPVQGLRLTWIPQAAVSGKEDALPSSFRSMHNVTAEEVLEHTPRCKAPTSSTDPVDTHASLHVTPSHAMDLASLPTDAYEGLWGGVALARETRALDATTVPGAAPSPAPECSHRNPWATVGELIEALRSGQMTGIELAVMAREQPALRSSAQLRELVTAACEGRYKDQTVAIQETCEHR